MLDYVFSSGFSVLCCLLTMALGVVGMRGVGKGSGAVTLPQAPRRTGPCPLQGRVTRTCEVTMGSQCHITKKDDPGHSESQVEFQLPVLHPRPGAGGAIHHRV